MDCDGLLCLAKIQTQGSKSFSGEMCFIFALRNRFICHVGHFFFTLWLKVKRMSATHTRKTSTRTNNFVIIETWKFPSEISSNQYYVFFVYDLVLAAVQYVFRRWERKWFPCSPPTEFPVSSESIVPLIRAISMAGRTVSHPRLLPRPVSTRRVLRGWL